MAKPEPTRRPRWTSNRLALALRAIAILPPKPQMTMSELEAELEVPRQVVRRLFDDLASTGIQILVEHRAYDGQKVYGIGKAGQRLIDKVLGQ